MKNEMRDIDENYLKNKIYIIRGQKVMLDSDLAEIYGYSVKRLNEQVKRNIEKFPYDFMFQLDEKEMEIIIQSQIATGSHRNKRFKPFVFTEQGVYMLMTILKGDLAVNQSVMLIRFFKTAKDLIIDNKAISSFNGLMNIEYRTKRLEDNVKEINTNLSTIMEHFDDPNNYRHFLIMNGKTLEADIAYKKIFKKAKKSIYYVDDYVGLKTLELLSFAREGVLINIFTDNKAKDSLKQYMKEDFINEHPTNKLSLYKTNNRIHDRYIVIDYNTENEVIYHCGASCKDAGNKVSTITKIEAFDLYRPLIKTLLKMPKLKF